MAVELSAEGGVVVIEGLMVPPPRRRGLGTWALGLLCGAADREGVTLAVVPEPVRLLVDAPIPPRALERFYASHGFRRDGGRWSRAPRA